MQMFVNPCKLCDFMWGTTMHRGTRAIILAPPSGRNHNCFEGLGSEGLRTGG